MIVLLSVFCLFFSSILYANINIDFWKTENGVRVYFVESHELPIVDIKTTFPKDLSTKERREWAILDTFDMFSPEHDHPQSFSSVESMFKKHNCEITFSGIVNMPDGFKSNVVRAIKKIDVT